jgi:two-component system CheB/CheR fusion protein
MRFPGGNASLNLLKMIRPELRLELRTALYEATQRRTNVEARNLIVGINGQTETINIQVRPVLGESDTARGFFLIVFQPADTPPESIEKIDTSDQQLTHSLEDELERTKVSLRSSSEQFEVQAEELKASNEELQAINEELRSSAEELETSKEELQAVNEELITVNQELKVKVEELSQSNNDFRNLINSTDIGTIFLDRSLRVNHFSPRAREVFNLLEADIGRPLSDLNSRLNYAEIRSDAEKVLNSAETVERDLKSVDGKTFLMQITPYKTADSRINGVVIAFSDITKRFEAEEGLRRAHSELKGILETMSDAFYTVDRTWNFTYVNSRAERFLGRKREELIGRSLWEVFPESEERELFEKLTTAAETGEQTFEAFSAKLKRWLEVNVSRADAGVYVYFRDISERKRREENLAFLAEINADLGVD